MKKSLIGLKLDELESIVREIGEKPFRARQIYEWIYQKNASDFAEMTNLSAKLRHELSDSYTIRSMKIVEKRDIGDTVKYLWELNDGQMVESVYMPSGDRVTICISSQVGCAVGCTFCATGLMGFKRNLTSGEIIEQVLQIRSHFTGRVSNIVFMGMGEPMLNYEAVIKAAEILHDPDAFGISARRITISTSGIIPQINRYASENQPYRLAISLNHVDQKKRESVMPITKKYTITDLLTSAKEYTANSKLPVTFEYVMLKNENISRQDADKLIKLTRNIPCKINLIPCNSLDEAYKRPSEAEGLQFKTYLEKANLQAFIRKTRGRSIEAACGMLHNTRTMEKPIVSGVD